MTPLLCYKHVSVYYPGYFWVRDCQPRTLSGRKTFLVEEESAATKEEMLAFKLYLSKAVERPQPKIIMFAEEDRQMIIYAIFYKDRWYDFT